MKRSWALLAACAVSAAGSVARAEAAPSQKDIWPIGSYAAALGNDAAVYLRTRQSGGVTGVFAYDKVLALANALYASLDGLSRSVCSVDKQVGAALSNSKDIVEALESVGGLSSAQASGDAEERIAASVQALRTSYAASPCAGITLAR